MQKFDPNFRNPVNNAFPDREPVSHNPMWIYHRELGRLVTFMDISAQQNKDRVSSLQQEVTQLKHKLRIRSQLLASFQQKSAKGDLTSLFEQLEQVTLETADLKRQNVDLANENALLGKAINKLKEQQTGTGDFSIKELQEALLDVSDECDRTKKQVASLIDEKNDLSARLKSVLESQREVVQDQTTARQHAVEMERSRTEEKAWKQRYLREVQTTLNLQSAQTALAEENRCHLEFITVLEGRLQALEQDRAGHFNRSLSDLHKRRFETATAALEMCRSKPNLQEQTAAAVLRTELFCEREVSQELKAELRRTAARCEELQTALSVARANLLQTSMRLETESGKVKGLEDMRLADICTITRLEQSQYTGHCWVSYIGQLPPVTIVNPSSLLKSIDSALCFRGLVASSPGS